MNRHHPTIYYRIRSVVRTVFWTTLIASTFVVIFEINDDDRPECDVTLDISGGRFTWNSEDFASLHPDIESIDDCRQPDNVVLREDGSWDWYDPEIG